MKLTLILLILLTLWIPVILDKIIDFKFFKSGILRQLLGKTLESILINNVSIPENLIAIFLLHPRIHYYKTWFSPGLMLAFLASLSTVSKGIRKKSSGGAA